MFKYFLNGILILSVLMFSHCNQSEIDDDIPFAIVQESINLNNFDFLPLKTIGGIVTIDAGSKGIILYRESTNKYRAFEQNCSYQPLDPCAFVELDQSGIFLIDKCCQSKFNFSGIPFEGPAFRPLLEYNTQLDGNFLLISN